MEYFFSGNEETKIWGYLSIDNFILTFLFSIFEWKEEKVRRVKNEVGFLLAWSGYCPYYL